MNAAPIVRYEVVGLRGALRDLGKLEPELRKTLQKDFRTALNVVRDDARRAMPASAPLSGMAHGGRTGWSRKAATSITVKTSGRNRRRRELTIAALALTNPAGSIYDMAGRASAGRTPQGRAMIAALGGHPSRVMWPTVEKNENAIELAVRTLTMSVERELNRSLAK